MSRLNDILPSTRGFSCNHCGYETAEVKEYDKHTAKKHPHKAGYPDRNGRTR